MTNPWVEQRADLVKALRADISFTQPGADHMQAASAMLTQRHAIQTHEWHRQNRQRLLKARHQVNTHLIEGLRKPINTYAVPAGQEVP